MTKNIAPLGLWDPTLLSDWDFEAVKGALDAHERGHFDWSGQLAEAMLRDERIASGLHTRLASVVAHAPTFEGETKACELARAHAPLMLDGDALYSSLKSAVMLGVSLAHVYTDATSVPGAWLPKLQPVPMQSVHWDTTRQAYVVATRSGPVVVDDAWALFGPRPYGWLAGAVRSLAVPWLVRQYALRDWARYSEKHGGPIVVAEIPESLHGREKEDFKRSMRAMGRDLMVFAPVLSNGDKPTLHLLETSDGSWAGFSHLIAQCDTSIAIRLLGQNLTSEVSGGSFAAAKVHDGVRGDIRDGDASLLAREMNRALMPRWRAWQGVGECAFRWDFEEEPTPAERADAWAKLAGAMNGLAAAGIELDTDAVARDFGVPLRGQKTLSQSLSAGETMSYLSAAGAVEAMVRAQAETALYMDALEGQTADRINAALEGGAEKALEIAGKVGGFDALKAALIDGFEGLTDDTLATVMAECLVLGEMRALLDARDTAQ